MTTTQTDETPTDPNVDDTANRDNQETSWASNAVTLAGLIASENFARGDLAQLRRMDPDSPDASAFWRLMARQDLFRNAETEAKWALIINGIALMTPTGNGDGNSRTAHDGYIPVGRALFQGGDAQRTTGFYSETRFSRLMTSRGAMLRILLCRMFRMLASAGVSFNWREMASFILSDGYDDEAAEQSRRRIARAYYQAERRQSQASHE